VEHRLKAGQVRDWMSAIKETEDLVSVGAYVPGSNPRVDDALAKRERIESFLKQSSDEACSLDDSIQGLLGI
jgi:flagellar biosynthesis/type III secretory pathway ATPase